MLLLFQLWLLYDDMNMQNFHCGISHHISLFNSEEIE